ncbi:MAG: peptidoglycan bridge formation glycyltransferase FemA/FemB family protein [Treponema sp.]|nr:peptidoglycan bridge formation glycyltransferase FemA/FemB family protein [Treponema sp.]
MNEVTLKREDLSFCDRSGNFLQSGFWGHFKASFEWEALAFSFTLAPGEEPSPLLVLRRRLAPGLSLAYVPWGPQLPGMSINEILDPEAQNRAKETLAALGAALSRELPPGCLFIRFDPPFLIDPSRSASLPAPFVASGGDIQPPNSVLIDLRPPMEEILGQMKPKWRYNARLALKKGVQIREAEAGEIGKFYELLKTTARRDGIAIHSLAYYRHLVEGASYGGSRPPIRLYLAEHGGDLLAGLVCLSWGRVGVYLYGASSDLKRNLMAPYALQVKAMEDAKASGCLDYDLFGIPPTEDEAHPMAGLYRFKTGFGGRIIRRPGSWDYPRRPLLYRLFRWAESWRALLMRMKKRRS